MQYFISYQLPHKHFIDLELHITNIQSSEIEIQLPAWRAGRYQLQDYAKNIQRFFITDTNDQAVHSQKITKDRWRVLTPNIDSIKVKYNYLAQQLDAGGSWLDEEVCYLNFVNFLLYVEGRIEEKYEINISLPPNYKVACGLNYSLDSVQPNQIRLNANNFYQAIDSPFLASAEIQHQSYQITNVPSTFHVWFYGNCQPRWEKLITDFKAFTQKQVDIFGDFPEPDYHFIFLIPDLPVYHGVEHANSTVIVLGEAALFSEDYFYNNLLGIASHELFHAWNICKIRPKELMPYDLTKENYFRTGFVVEGITTFYGDWLLARSGVWSKEIYFNELKLFFKRHFYNFGRWNMSVADSSFDLWLDGYAAGIPNRKSSIYVEGAMVCLLLDLEIRQATDHQRSMDNVLKLLWERFGKMQIGYSLEDYINLVNEVSGKDMKNYFDDYIFGTKDLAVRLHTILQTIGCELITTDSENTYAQTFGFLLALRNGELVVELIEPHAPADEMLTLKDKILCIDNQSIMSEENILLNDLLAKKTIATLTINRNGKEKEVIIKADGKSYLPEYEIKELENKTKKQEIAFENWLKG
jgi:predicted metalloprotease with PDZ domain